MPRQSLRDEAYHIIYEQIIGGALAKGAVTSEVQLSRQLDMSRTPVRAALQQLENEGFLRIIPKHGVLVLDSSAQRVGDLLELLTALLLYAVTSVRLRDEAALGDLSRQLVHELESLLAASDELSLEISGGYSPALEIACDHRPALEPAGELALCQFEYDFVSRVIALSHNQEMQQTLANSASRLFWAGNKKRWIAPYRLEMGDTLHSLLSRLTADTDSFIEAMNKYLHMLKKTWI
ncbi:GntR family transcriptional regulator [Paenibacillus sp. CF384]|uniref:GntR family transcriptional regulator n=1 Tax=Paenibacillus sp. CF384 TaxID=1884382 RepID=UPI00089A1FAE|nr:GntR family transcriptional regulator [Paenibacillus sp. CF384]SDY02352.1 regulatory protein, gntR family [Paenibacillus sp. CF384]